MARKKKKTHHTRRRRRMGATMTASNPLIKFAPIALGFFMSDKINTPIVSAVGTKIDGKIIGAAEAGLGAYLVFGNKNETSIAKTVAGGILLGAGAKKLMTEFGIGNIGGYGAVPVIGGYGAVPVIGGRSVPRRVGAYSTNGQVGAYRVPKQVSVMNGVNIDSGSGITRDNASGYMG